jgi:GNAT superfamily N-acetyltransferase
MKIKFDLFANVPEYSNDIAKWLYMEWGDMFNEISNIKTQEELATYYTNTLMETVVVPLGFVGYDEETNKFVCFCSLEKSDMNVYDSLSPWLSKLFVVPEYRGQGIAAQLVSFAIDYIDINTMISNIFVWTDNTNTGIVKFFEKNKFFVIGTHSQHGRYKELIIMERRKQ